MTVASTNTPEDPQWNLITEFSIATYECGAKAGEYIRLKKDLPITQGSNRVQVGVYKQGRTAVVLKGSKDSPLVLWCRWLDDGENFTWDDEPEFFDWFEVVDKIVE